MKKVYTSDGKVKIKNEVGTSKRPTCSCGGWLNHWELFSGLSASQCSVDGCTQKAVHGAHVTRPKAEFEGYRTHSYIVPMCASHNGQHGETFDSKPKVTFVWANVQSTCG